MGFFVVVRVHESRSTSSEGDPQLGKFVLSRQVNLNTHIMKNKQPKISNYFETSQILLLIKQPD